MILFKVFHILLTMSFLGTITALVILFVKKIFKQKISAFWHYSIWLILLIRLIIPYAPESNLSIFNLFINTQKQTEEIQSPLIQMDYNSIKTNNEEDINILQQENSEQNLLSDPYYSKIPLPENKKNLILLNTLVNQGDYLSYLSANNPNKHSKQIFRTASIIWLLGVSITAIFIILIQISFIFKIKKLSICNDKEANVILKNCKEKLKIRKKIPLILDPMINTPSLMGIINSKIIISPNCIELLTADELKYVFIHELAHYKQKDIIIRWILILLQILHWFNPVLWFAFDRIRQDSEQACDARVLSNIEPDDFKKYGKTMLKMLNIFSDSDYQHGIAGIINKKKMVMERVRNIMKFQKHCLIWSLVGIILFSSLTICLLTNAQGQTTEVIKIKYTAEELTQNIKPGTLNKIQVLSNNKLLTYDNNDHQFIIIDNQGNKENIFCEELPEDHVELFTTDFNDYIYIFIENKDPLIYVYNLKGEKIKEINLEFNDINFAEEKQVYRWDMEVDSRGNIYILIPGKNTQLFNSVGKYIKTIASTTNYSIIELDKKGNLYTIDWNNKVVITKQNPLADKILWQYEDDKNLSHIIMARYLSNDYLYLMTSNSIFLLNLKNGSLQKLLYLDSILKKTDQNNFLLRDFNISTDGSIYLCGYKQQIYQGCIFRVTSRKIKIDDDIKTLTISVQALTPTLEYAVNKFENHHPDIVINIENYNAFSWFTTPDMTYQELLEASAESSQKKYNYVKKMNNRMLTGNGPDILQLDNIPYRRYADKNMLLDLKKLMENDASFHKNSYYTNILEALEYKNKLYIMPLSFSYPALLANTGFLKEQTIDIDDKKWSWNNFITIAHKSTKDINGDGKIDIYGMPTITPERLLQHIYNSIDRNFIDYESKKVYFKSKEFIDLLTYCQKMSKDNIMDPDITEINTNQGGIVFYPYNITDYAILYSNWLINADRVSFYRYPGLNNNRYTFDVNGIYGINNKTQYKEEAWEFIKYLISEEIQSYNKLYDIAINKKARINKIQDRLTEVDDMINKFGILYGYQVSSADKIKKQLTNNLNILDEIIPRLNNFSINDIKIKQIIREEIQRFFIGEQSVGYTAQIIQEKVEIYLNK
ncbi:MAG: extracellular solute-binding protein [Firmicutes bacterium]|nr:extracellular solute-binding protein [Bacillota bacterium]